MPENFYSDAEAPAPAAPEAEPKEGESSDSQTAEIPKAVLGGKEFKPGEEVVMEIVQVNEDSVVVKYAEPSEKEEPPEESAAEPAAEGGGGGNPGGMSSMMY